MGSDVESDVESDMGSDVPLPRDILSDPALNGVYRLADRGELLPVLDGRGLADKHSLLSALGRALDFPDYYGENWDALEEGLADLSWRETKPRAKELREKWLERLFLPRISGLLCITREMEKRGL